MSVPSSLVPQLVLNCLIPLGLVAYLPRALRQQKLRFAVVVLALVEVAAICANLRGYALRGPMQGFRLTKI